MNDRHVSWEKEQNIPKHIIKEFEMQMAVHVMEISTQRIGQTSNTLIVNPKTGNNHEPDKKVFKQDRVIVEDDNGYYKCIKYKLLYVFYHVEHLCLILMTTKI